MQSVGKMQGCWKIYYVYSAAVQQAAAICSLGGNASPASFETMVKRNQRQKSCTPISFNCEDEGDRLLRNADNRQLDYMASWPRRPYSQPLGNEVSEKSVLG
jgi:hypothetical protein